MLSKANIFIKYHSRNSSNTIPQFYILGSRTERPASRKTIFVDGSPDSTYREGVDLELSHWIPNRTPANYKADTSTEICMKFIKKNSPTGWDLGIDLAVNNHIDVDGILALFTLIQSDVALKHRDTLVQAAEMGDFWGIGRSQAIILFQELTFLIHTLRSQKQDGLLIYQNGFELTLSLLEDRQQASPTTEHAMDLLQKSTERVDSKLIERHPYNQRFVCYILPKSLWIESHEKALKVPPFNGLITDNMWLHPQVRCQKDREKIHLVSIETDEGWLHDLWYPGYMWADTPNSWRAPGFQFSGSTNGYFSATRHWNLP